MTPPRPRQEKGAVSVERSAHGFFALKFSLFDTLLIWGLLTALVWAFASSQYFVEWRQDAQRGMDELVVSERSAWNGLSSVGGGLRLPHNSPVSVATVALRCDPFTRYNFTIASDVGSSFWVDFFAGAAYDNPRQQFRHQQGEGRVRHSYGFTSDACPAVIQLRILYEGQRDVLISHFKVYKEAGGIGKLLVDLAFALIYCLPLLLLPAMLYRYRKQDAAVALLAGFLVAGTYFAFIAQEPLSGSDNTWYLPTAFAIIEKGTISLDQFTAMIEAVGRYGVAPGLDGSFTNFFPPGTSLILVPFVFVGKLLNLSMVMLAKIYAVSMAAGSVMLLVWMAIRLGLSHFPSLALGLVFGLATSHLSVHANGLWSHNAGLLLAMMLAALLLEDDSPPWLISAVMALGYVVRPDFAIFIVAGFAVLLWRRRETAVHVALLGGILGTGFFLWSYLTYGTLQPPYYGSGRLTPAVFPEAFPGQLFSPNRGLFIFNPIFLLSLAGAYLAWAKAVPQRWFFRFLSIICGIFILMTACFPHWWGGHSFGPRLHAPIYGFLMLLVVPCFLQLGISSRPMRWGILGFALAATALGGYIHWWAVLDSAPMLWNALPNGIDSNPTRLWDWGDLQFLRGR